MAAEWTLPWLMSVFPVYPRAVDFQEELSVLGGDVYAILLSGMANKLCVPLTAMSVPGLPPLGGVCLRVTGGTVQPGSPPFSPLVEFVPGSAWDSPGALFWG